MGAETSMEVLDVLAEVREVFAEEQRLVNLYIPPEVREYMGYREQREILYKFEPDIKQRTSEAFSRLFAVLRL